MMTKHTLSTERELSSEQQLEAMAAAVARSAQGGLVVFLQGDLGAGKTTFARGFLRGRGITGVVKSPTYTLVEPYTLDDGSMCYHFDLYRLAHGEELEFTGARDYFDGISSSLIEWPEKAEGYLPVPDLVCRLSYLPNGRKAEISALSEKGRETMLQAFPDLSL